MLRMRSVVALSLMLLVSEEVFAQGSGLCPGLAGSARTRCLQNERARSQARADADNQNLARLNRRQETACAVAGYGREAATAAGGVAGTTAGHPVAGAVGGGLAYDVGRAGGRRVAGDDGCRR